MSKLLNIRQRTIADIYQLVSEGPIPQHFVWWDEITDKKANNFEQIIIAAKDERPIQCFLEINPLILVQHLSGGHGRWVVPRQRFGAEYIPDFVIGQRNSLGFHWTLVELESPCATLFTKSGNPTSTLNHAIRQISDWRAWLKKNRDYAVRSDQEGGLGFTDIDFGVPGLILIGRRQSIPEKCNALRRQLSDTLNIQIHTYDYLIDAARQRVSALAKSK